MDMAQFLGYCEQLENRQAFMYEKLSRSFSSDENASHFFGKLGMDETAHLDAVQKMRTMAAKDLHAFTEVRVDTDEIKRILARSNYVLHRETFTCRSLEPMLLD